MKKKILMVDDDLDLCLIFQTVFEHLGYDSVFAVDGAEAVKIATTQKPDLILMDIIMPVMNGYQATRMIRQNPKTRSIPIIAVTALTSPEEREECLKSGCDDYIAKPFKIKDLASRIEKLLNQESS
jgi:CheY-like chemotaxis protein